MTARCHWCRHVLGVNEQVANGAVPDAVLPFHIKKDDAVARIRQFVDKRRLFALKAFKEQFTPENVVGVYLPYMIVDGNVERRRRRPGRDPDARSTREAAATTRRPTTTPTCTRCDRHVDFTVDDLPLESSAERGNLDTTANTNNIINTILPFDTKNAVKWNASYLSGFTSEKRDLDVEHLRPRLEDQLLSIARVAGRASRSSRYDRGVRWEQERLDVHGTRWVSMYLPVWLYSYHQPGSNGGMLHYIAVNGRTGETMGSVPVQQWKLLAAALTVGTFLEGIALLVASHDRRDRHERRQRTLWLLAAGPAGAAALYWALYRYYRNTDKSHAFERETIIKPQPVQGGEERVDHISKTRDSDIDGDNSSQHRKRVERLS